MMEILRTSLAFLVAFLLAGVMGYAIRRGGTCSATLGPMLAQRVWAPHFAGQEA